jgi:hypothetical protein
MNMNNSHWLEEQLNKDYRREAERRAEHERASHSDDKRTAWQWLQDLAR